MQLCCMRGGGGGGGSLIALLNFHDPPKKFNICIMKPSKPLIHLKLNLEKHNFSIMSIYLSLLWLFLISLVIFVTKLHLATLKHSKIHMIGKQITQEYNHKCQIPVTPVSAIIFNGVIPFFWNKFMIFFVVSFMQMPCLS